MISRLFVPGTKQLRLEPGRSLIGTDGLGWLTPGRTSDHKNDARRYIPPRLPIILDLSRTFLILVP